MDAAAQDGLGVVGHRILGTELVACFDLQRFIRERAELEALRLGVFAAAPIGGDLHLIFGPLGPDRATSELVRRVGMGLREIANPIHRRYF
jgi:hypothetical protein